MKPRRIIRCARFGLVARGGQRTDCADRPAGLV